MATKDIKFNLISITTEEFATIKEAYKGEDTIGIATSFNFGVDHDQSIIAVELDLKFESEGKPFILLKLRMEFDIEPDSFKSLQRGKSIIVPKGFLTHLAVLLVGTARGVLHARLDKTELCELILPTLNISTLIDKDMEVAME